MSRQFALFDSGNKGASLSVENGGVLLTTTAAGLSIARSCRSTISQTRYSSDVEFILFGTGNIANKVSIGLCTASAPMSAYIGADGESIGYRPAEGQIHTGGASVASVVTAGLSSAIRVVVVFGTTPTAAWYVDGTLIHEQALPAGMALDAIYFAVSLGSDAAPGDIKVQATTGDGTHGSRQMEFPGAGFSGWWTPYSLPEAVRIATIEFLSHHDDDVPHTRWHGGITGRSGGDTRGFSVGVWGATYQVQGSVLQLEYTDPDGRLDVLLTPAYRDQPVQIAFVEAGAALATAVETQLWFFDRCEVVDDLTKRLYFKDIISLLDLSLQHRAFRPDVDPQAANRWMPTLIGVAGSIPVTLVDADESSAPNPTFQISGQDVEQIGKVRDAGVPLDSSAPDFELLAGGQQIQLAAEPAGEITLDASRTGGSYVPTVPVDAVGGEGNPFVDAGGGDIVGWGRFKDDPAIPDTTPYFAAPDRVAFPQNANEPRSHISKESSPGVPELALVAGQRYRYRMTVHYLPPATSGLSAMIGLSYDGTQFTPYSGNSAMNSTNFWAGNPAGDPRVIEDTFVAAVTHAPAVYFKGTSNIAGSPAEISGLTFIELPPLNDTGDDEIVEDALPKLTLEAAMRMILEVHGGMLPTMWDSDQAAAIDTATGYEGGGTYFDEQATLREALDRFMAGYNAGIYKKRDGTLGVLQLAIPEDEIGSDPVTVDGSTFLSDMTFRRDPGLGISRQVGARKNFRLLTDADLDTTALNLTQRARLAREHRYVLATGASFAPGYDHVDAAEPIDTALWMPADAQATANRIGEYYGVGRGFYEATMPYRDDIDTGTICLLVYDRYGMEAGIPVQAFPLNEDRINNQMTVMFWGPAPYEEF